MPNETEQKKYARGKNPNSIKNLKGAQGVRITSETASELGRKGGLKAQEMRRQKVLMRDTLAAVLGAKITDAEMVAELQAAGLPIDMQGGILLAAAKKALGGDIDAARFLRDTLGQKPTDTFNLAVEQKPIQALNLAELTDEQLQALAERAERSALPPKETE